MVLYKKLLLMTFGTTLLSWWRFLMHGRALGRQSLRADSVISWDERIQRWGVFCYCGDDKLKKKNSTGHFGSGSKNAEKIILVSTRTLEDITIPFSGVLTVAKKKNYY